MSISGADTLFLVRSIIVLRIHIVGLGHIQRRAERAYDPGKV